MALLNAATLTLVQAAAPLSHIMTAIFEADKDGFLRLAFFILFLT
jgi:hypothetical protein